MNDWIPITERLPEMWAPVLITDGKIVTCAELSDTSRMWWTGHGFGGYEWEFDFEYEAVTHWMPLPEPPNKTTS